MSKLQWIANRFGSGERCAITPGLAIEVRCVGTPKSNRFPEKWIVTVFTQTLVMKPTTLEDAKSLAERVASKWLAEANALVNPPTEKE